MKKITFFIIQFSFIFSINIFVYIDLMLDVLSKDKWGQAELKYYF